MFGIIALILLLGWLFGFFAFHVTAYAFHVLLIVAVIALVVQLASGRRGI